jgi:ATP:ADP antiporter, AAA family
LKAVETDMIGGEDVMDSSEHRLNRTPASADQAARKPVLLRLLGLVADVRPGESLIVIIMALNMFLVLAAYYMLKTVRESLILSEAGAAVKTYSSAGQAVLLLLLVPAFGALASRVNRLRLVSWVTLFFVSNILLFIVAGSAGVRIGIPYYLWVGVFNVMVIAQFWAFANDLYTPEQGKRLFPVIGIGSSLGAWLGSLYAGDVIRVTGPFSLMIVAGLLLVACIILLRVAHHRHIRTESTEKIAEGDKPLGRVGGFTLIRQQRYLLLITLMTVVLNVVNTSGEYIFGKYVVEESIRRFGGAPESLEARQRFIGGVYGTFFSYINLLGFLLQTFAVSRIFKYFGVGRALLIHPIVALCGYVLMLKAPSVTTIAWVKVFDNSLDYSLGNTTKQALWLPTSREAKYKAKQAVDSFFMRVGDIIQAGVVFVGERLAFGVTAFAGLNIALALAWISINIALGATYNKKTGGDTESRSHSN